VNVIGSLFDELGLKKQLEHQEKNSHVTWTFAMLTTHFRGVFS